VAAVLALNLSRRDRNRADSPRTSRGEEGNRTDDRKAMAVSNKMRAERAVYGVGQVGTWWTLIASDGAPFVSLGVAHIANILKSATFQSRYAADPRAACETVPRACALGSSTRPATVIPSRCAA
jgi:hypothetical protein